MLYEIKLMSIKKKYDIVILTDSRFLNSESTDEYVQNVLLEDKYAKVELERKGLRVGRTNWDNADFDWTETEYVIFKTTWDYFDRFEEFSKWLDDVSKKTKLINRIETIRWNVDKHYLLDLNKKGVNVPNTIFIEQGDTREFAEIYLNSGWKDSILKPVVSGGGRHTYKINKDNAAEHETIYRELIKNEAMMLQEFQYSVLDEGEKTFMVFGGKYSHAVLKKAKAGDFRVQDDYGGSVHEYIASKEEVEFAEWVVSLCNPIPVYGRVDAIKDNEGKLAVSELELIEPEMWFRMKPGSAEIYAEEVLRAMNRY